MKTLLFLLSLFVFVSNQNATGQQNLPVEVSRTNDHNISIRVNGQPFAALFYADTFPKPVLFPIYAADGEVITRGFPLDPRTHEPTDHPHHVGLWLNYENVNGLDFWNNSYAIPPDKRSSYGSIIIDSITDLRSGIQGKISYTADWEDAQQHTLLKEITTYVFTAMGNTRIIDRTTRLTAVVPVTFPDAKDGMLGLRVAHELELPSKEDRTFTDNKGNLTTVKATEDKVVSGNYITSEGKQGDDAWGTRARWCLLYGKKGKDSISIAIIDHPDNPGYPTYWHARGYGLFAANPLGEKVFSQGKEELGFKLATGASAIFRYRVVIYCGKQRLMNADVNRLADEFGHVGN